MRSVAYKHYVLGVLAIVLMFNGVDRVALGVLLQAIKANFDLSDTQLGLLGGIGFALFFSIMRLPLARWADRGNRVIIIASTCALWSAGVAHYGWRVTFMVLGIPGVLLAPLVGLALREPRRARGGVEWHAWRASRTVARDVDDMEAGEMVAAP